MSRIPTGPQPARRVLTEKPTPRVVVYAYARCIEAGCAVQTSKGTCRRHRRNAT